MLEHAVANGVQQVDVLIGPENEGDAPYQQIMEEIQHGTWSQDIQGWQWMMRPEFIDRFVSEYGIVKGGGYFVVAEGSTAVGAIIQLQDQPTPLASYEIADDYVYGEIPIVQQPFIRGDVNEDGQAQMSDSIRLLWYLFLDSSSPLRCSSAADINDDGDLNIADPIYLLSYLFSKGKAPAEPFEVVGLDQTSDDLPCGCYRTPNNCGFN